MGLPEDLKDAIFGVDTAEAVEAVAKKYGLLIDKMGALADETGLVMLGLTHPKDFIAHLAERLGTDRLTARNIAEDINSQIFQKIRESLKKIHGIEESAPLSEGVEGIKPPPASPPRAELKPLEIKPGPSITPVKPPTPAAWPEVLQKIQPPEKPAAPAPQAMRGSEIKPLGPTPAGKPPPGLAFEEKTKESIFRTPSETREKIEERPPNAVKEKSFAEIKKEIGKTQADPYREAIE